jgi:hypothetical protein
MRLTLHAPDWPYAPCSRATSAWSSSFRAQAPFVATGQRVMLTLTAPLHATGDCAAPGTVRGRGCCQFHDHFVAGLFRGRCGWAVIGSG